MLSLKALGQAGDATANQFLIHALREQRPADGLLSEEEKDNSDRLSLNRVWIVDPVDGTREYGEPSMREQCRPCANATATGAQLSHSYWPPE